MNIDMGKLSKESGKSELELTKQIVAILAMKARFTGITQRVVLDVKESE